MRKKDELARDDTCMARAHPEEMVFVLLGRDPAAPAAVRAWAAERIRLGKNTPTDQQIVDALAIVDTMEAEGRRWVTGLHVMTLDPAPTRDELAEALAESVKLQSHYATLLNQHDGGNRVVFADARDWVQRLREVSETTRRLRDRNKREED